MNQRSVSLQIHVNLHVHIEGIMHWSIRELGHFN